MSSFQLLCEQLGIPLAEDNTIGPSTQITILGLEIDTDLMLVKIPENKLLKLKRLFLIFIGKKRMSLKDLESLTGLLAFCSMAIVSARVLSRRFYDFIAWAKGGKPYYTIRLNQEVNADAQVWIEFLEKFNGICYIPEMFSTSSDALELYTDSTGNSLLGCGAYFNGHWVQFQWPKNWAELDILADITCLELVPIVLAFYIWGPNFRNKKY